MIEIAGFVYSQRKIPRRALKSLRGERKVFRKAVELQKQARSLIYASWCISRFSLTTEDYFKDTTKEIGGKQNLVVHRLINVPEVGDDRVKGHLDKHLDMIKDGRYVVYSTDHKAFEYIIVDRKDALFLAPHAVRADLYMGLYGREESFVYCLIELFNEMCKKGDRLEMPQTDDKEELRAHINRWVDRQTEKN